MLHVLCNCLMMVPCPSWQPSILDVHILRNYDHINPHGCQLNQKTIIYGCSQSIKDPLSRPTGNPTHPRKRVSPNHVLQTIRSLPHRRPGHQRRCLRESPTPKSTISIFLADIDFSQKSGFRCNLGSTVSRASPPTAQFKPTTQIPPFSYPAAAKIRGLLNW